MDRTLYVIRTTLDWIDRGRTFAVALVLRAEGSTPRGEAVRAAIDPAGEIVGTIGGGLVEAEAQRLAVEACRSGEPAVVTVSLGGHAAREPEPLCGGGMRVLIDPTAAQARDPYAAALEALERRERGVLRTRVRRGQEGEVSVEVDWHSGDAFPRHELQPHAAPPAGPESRGGPQERAEVLLEPLEPEPRLLVVGGGHIGRAVAAQAQPLGFDVTVIDDRPEFADPSRFPPEVSVRCAPVAEGVRGFPMEADTYVVIVTRGHQHDAAALAACVRSPAAYVGMIGSRRKVALLWRELLESRLATAAELERVFAPIGLDIGAVTVPEIATSIAAELVLVRRKGRRMGAGAPLSGSSEPT